jgi:multidrug efflux pump subunit AcrB
MELITAFFIRNYKLTIVLSLGMVIFGIMGLFRMSSESFPNVNFAMAVVTTPFEGASAEDIETKITKPLEDEIRTVSGLKDVRSVSQAGLSTIFVRADIDDDSIPTETIMSDLQKAIDRATDLPANLTEQPKFEEIKTEEMPVYEIAILGSNEGRRRDQIADDLKEELEDNRLVKGVRLAGFAEREFHVQLDLKKMREFHIGINEVNSKIRARNVSVPGGSLKDGQFQQLVRIKGEVENAEELGNVLIRSNFSGQQVYLKNIAEVKDSEAEILVHASYGDKDSTLLIASKKGGADTIKLVASAEESVSLFREMYGQNYEFIVYNNESNKVKDKLEVLGENAVTGLILVVVFLFIFLPGRIGIMASLSLPLAVLATIGIMPVFGMNLNAITILALVIALGMMVDNSVVISENFTRLRLDGLRPYDAALLSVKQLWLPITATGFTTIAAFLPMLVTKGIMGQFIKFIPIIVSASLIFSLLESFIFLPMRLAKAGGKVKEKKEGAHHDWFAKFEEKFEKMMRVLVRRRYIMGFVFTMTIAFSFFMMVKANRFILFPSEQTELYIARFEMPRGTRVLATQEAAQQLARKINGVIGEHVEHITSRSGTSKADFTDPKAEDGNSVGISFIRVNENAKNNVEHTEILKNLRTISSEGIGFKRLSFEAMINGPPVGNDIEATFRSNTSESLEKMVEIVKEQLQKIEGISDLKVDDVIGDNEVFVLVDYEKADRLGLTVRSIGDAVQTAVSGQIVSTVTLANKDVDLFVQYASKDREDTESLSKIEVMDQRGNLVPIGQFAEFRVDQGSPQIKRFDFKRSKTLTGNVSEEVITAVQANARLKEIFDEHALDLPNVSLRFGGVAENTKESMESLFTALILSLIGIFALLVFLFNSYLRPAIIMSTIPLGLFGFSIAFYLHERPISFLALIGVIGLGGIIVNAGIVLISFIDQLREEGNMSFDDILAKASRLRLRAVFVTSLTTISGLIPTAYGIGGDDAMLIPMTLAMAWGLTSGTILTLVWVPCAYAILEDFTLLMAKWTGLRHSSSIESHAAESYE